ncbi:MAG: hypothetical protein ACTTG4_08530 [Moraxella sp.]
MTTQTLQGRIYSGVLYARVHGTQGGYFEMGNAEKLTTKTETEKKELKSTGKDDYGQAISAIVIPKPTQIELEFSSFDKYALARALMGEAVDLPTNTQTIEETSVKAAKTGWIKLNHDDIDPAHFELKNKTKQVIAKEKYRINADLGMVMLLDSTGISDDDNLYYTGKTRGTKGFAIEANTLTDMHLELILDGKDRVTGYSGTLTIPHVVLSADGSIDWFSDDWWQSGLSGTVVKDTGKAAMTFKEFTG